VIVNIYTNPEGKECVNHINCDRSDNSIENLEWTTHRENVCHSISVRKNKLAGITKTRNNTWRATIYHDGKLITLGTRKTEEEATKLKTDFQLKHNIKNKYS
jgi:hypothetical protein